MATQVSLNDGAVASAGALAIQTNGTTQAVSISTGQVATLAQNPILTSGTANGVAYLNGSKAVTSGSALVFDGTNLGLGGTTNTYGSQTTLTLSGSNVSRIDFRSNGVFTGTLLSYQSVTEGLRLSTEAGYPITFYPAGSEAMRLTSTSLYTASTINVGIGTSSIDERLCVVNTGTFASVRVSNGTNSSYFGYANADTNYNSDAKAGDAIVRGFNGVSIAGGGGSGGMRLDSSGNLGLGVTPSVWNTIKPIEIARAGSFVGANSSGSTYLGANTRFASNWIYANNGPSGLYTIEDNTHFWRTAPSGTAGNTITFTQAMTLDASGRLGVGYTAPTAQVVVGGAGAAGWLNGARNTLQLRFNASSANQSNFISFGSANNEQYCFIGNDINADGTTVNQLNVQAGASGGVFLANTGTSWTAVSDERNKDIIEPITDAMAKVATLRSVIGKYKTDEQDKRRTFLIAQDVQAVLPEAITVGSDENSTLGLSYTDTIPLLVAAIKELKAEFDAYKASQP